MADLDITGLAWVAVIGQGGFGIVHRATDEVHGREVAVKVLPPLVDDSARRRFDRERRAMGTLSGHPNIAVVHTSGFTTRHEPYIVMELLEGGSLSEHIGRQPMSIDDIIQTGVALADALTIAHEEGVLHLDLKPDNVLLSKYGRPKIVDFGISAIVGDEHTTSTIRATPSFADPAIINGEKATPSSDIYGLAATLYALLEGRAPYTTGEGDTALSVLRSLATENVPHTARPGTPAELDDLLHRSMSKEPAGRPASMQRFHDELQALPTTPTEPALAAPITPPTAVVRPKKADLQAPPPMAAPIFNGPAGTSGPSPIPPPSPAQSKPSSSRERKLGFALLGAATVLLLVIFLVVTNRGGEGGGPGTIVPRVSSTIGGDTSGTVLIPDVTGLESVEAQAAIRNAGLDVLVEPHCFFEVDSQNPPANSNVEPGATVELNFPPCVVPDFVGMRLPEAQQVVEAINAIGIVWPDFCADLILGQDIAAGTIVEPGTTISLDLPSVC